MGPANRRNVLPVKAPMSIGRRKTAAPAEKAAEANVVNAPEAEVVLTDAT